MMPAWQCEDCGQRQFLGQRQEVGDRIICLDCLVVCLRRVSKQAAECVRQVDGRVQWDVDSVKLAALTEALRGAGMFECQAQT